jgi:hypothetical protein
MGGKAGADVEAHFMGRTLDGVGPGL